MTLSESLRRLGQVSHLYETLASSANEIYTDAARADATHRHQRARLIVRTKAEADFRMSHAEAETRADTDDLIAELHLKKVVTNAAMEALKEKLRQMREQVATGRTAVVDERGVDQIHGRGIGGAA